MPRTVASDPRDARRLLFWPIEEVAALRPPAPAARLTNTSVCGGCAATLLRSGGGGDNTKLDVLLRVRRPAAAAAGLNVTLALLQGRPAEGGGEAGLVTARTLRVILELRRSREVTEPSCPGATLEAVAGLLRGLTTAS